MKLSVDEYISMQQDGQVLNEAFKAGNKARKKESARDMVEEGDPLVDVLLSEINGDLICKYLKKNKFLTVYATFRDIIMYVLGRLTNVEHNVLHHCLEVYTYRRYGKEFGIIYFRTMGSFKTRFDGDCLVFEIKNNDIGMTCDFYGREDGTLLAHIDEHEDKFSESCVTAAGIRFCLRITEMFNRFREETDIYEAFKAGNRARKKESVRDNTDSVNAYAMSQADAEDLFNTAVMYSEMQYGIKVRNTGNMRDRCELYVMEFIRKLFGYVTGLSALEEYLKISTFNFGNNEDSGDMWISFWGTKKDTQYTRYSKRWMLSWFIQEIDSEYTVSFYYNTFAENKNGKNSTDASHAMRPFVTFNNDGSFETGPEFMSFINDFVTESVKMYRAGLLIPQHPVHEAFRAGNRSRKKETVQAAVESVDNLQAQIDKFKEQTGIELEIKDGRPYYNDHLSLKNCRTLTFLPDGLLVDGYLNLDGCIKLTALPNRLTVFSWMSLKNCNLTSLPPDLSVKGNYIYSIPHSLGPFFEKLGMKIDKEGDISAYEWMEKRHLVSQMDEAFKAGNRSRKKEGAVDVIQTTEQTITCREAVAKLAEFLREPVKAPWNPRENMPRCGDEDELDEAVEYAEPADDGYSDDLYNFELDIFSYSGGYRGSFSFDSDNKIYINIYEVYGKDAEGNRDKSVKIPKVSIGVYGVGSDNGTFDLLKQGRSDNVIYRSAASELTPVTFASLMELCRVLFPLNGNDSKLSYFIGGGNDAERVWTYGQFLYANQKLLWPWLCEEDRILVYEIEDEINQYDEMDEAFKTGNRTRKKESIQDTVQEVGESVEDQIRRYTEETSGLTSSLTSIEKPEIINGRPYMTGPINIYRCGSLTRLPDNLHIHFGCSIKYCPNIEAIPPGLSTDRGALNVDCCENLKYVPNDISIGNIIYLTNCPSLESLPEGLKVPKSILLNNCTALKSLPENFKVGDILNVTGCISLKTLPKGLSVGCLCCERSGLTELPFDIRFTDLESPDFIRPNDAIKEFFQKTTGVPFNPDNQPAMKRIWCKWQQNNGYVDYGIDFSEPEPVNEGGKAVKGAGPIRGDLALTVANKAASALMQQLPGVKIVPVGSVGKKPADQESGDIDLAVQVPWEQKDLVIQAVQKLVPDAECREFKALWLVSAPWPWREDGLYGRVQLDMFLGPDIRLTQFMRWSPNLTKGESKYKGLYRTALLISIASCIPAEGKQDVKFDGSDCIKDCWRYSLSPRTGLRIVHKTWASKTGKMLKNPRNVDEDTVIVAVDPQIIAVKLLGEGATLNDCVSLESVWKRMQSPQFPYKQYQDQILKEYYKYLQDAGEELPAMKQNEDNTDVKKD